MTGRRAAIATPSTIAQPTPKTSHLVRSGVTQIEPTIGDAAINRANNHSPGDSCAVNRMTRSISQAAAGAKPSAYAVAMSVHDLG